MEYISASITTLSTTSIVLLFVAFLVGTLLFMEGVSDAFDEDKTAFKGCYTAGFVILLVDLVICACTYFHVEDEYAKVAQDVCQSYGIQDEYQQEIAETLPQWTSNELEDIVFVAKDSKGREVQKVKDIVFEVESTSHDISVLGKQKDLTIMVYEKTSNGELKAVEPLDVQESKEQ